MNIRKLLLTALLFVPALAFAATPAVESERTSEASGGGTSHTVTLPATISADSLILVCSSTTANHTTTWPGGWTEIIDTANGTQQSATCGYKQAVGTEDSTTISLTTSGSTRTVHKSWSITGWDTGTAPEVQSANSSGNSVTSDPPSITPSGGSDDYLYLTFSTIRIADKNVSAYPSGHTNTGEFDGSVTAGQNSIGWSRKATTASSSENPSAYTWSGSDENIALTLAVTPAAPLGPTLTLSDATPDIDTSVTATLSSAFGAGGNPTTATLSSGDTVACSSATSTTCTFTPAWSDLQPAAGTTFDFTDRDLGDLQPYFSRTGAQTGVAVDGTLETIADGLPAFDGTRGWLAEESRTNVENSSSDSTQWTQIDSSDPDSVVAPDGTLTADSITELTAHENYAIDSYVTPVSLGDKWTFSVWLKAPVSGEVHIGVARHTGGTYEATTTLASLSTEWQRFDVTHTFGAAHTAVRWFIVRPGSGDTIDTIHVWGVQLEQGAFPTSYIPTNGTTATRQPTTLTSALSALGVDEVTNGIAGALLLYPSFGSNPSSTKHLFSLSDGLSAQIAIYAFTSGNLIAASAATTGGSATPNVTVTGGWSPGDPLLIRFRKTTAGFKVWVNEFENENTVVGVNDFAATVTEMSLGSSFSGAAQGSGVYSTYALWTGDDIPIDAELAALKADDLTEALNGTGELAKTQLQTGYTVTLTNGTETSQSTAVTLQMPVSGYSLVDLTCTFGVDCTEDTKAISPMVVGDDCAIKVTSGTLSELSSHCAPVFNSRVGAYSIARFDESAGAWLGQTEYLFISNSVTPGVESDITDDIQDDINTDITGDSL